MASQVLWRGPAGSVLGEDFSHLKSRLYRCMSWVRWGSPREQIPPAKLGLLGPSPGCAGSPPWSPLCPQLQVQARMWQVLSDYLERERESETLPFLLPCASASRIPGPAPVTVAPGRTFCARLGPGVVGGQPKAWILFSWVCVPAPVSCQHPGPSLPTPLWTSKLKMPECHL